MAETAVMFPYEKEVTSDVTKLFESLFFCLQEAFVKLFFFPTVRSFNSKNFKTFFLPVSYGPLLSLLMSWPPCEEELTHLRHDAA